MRILILGLLAAVFMSAQPVWAQNPVRFYGTLVQVQGGPSFVNYDELNAVMEDSGYRAFAPTHWAFGFSIERFSGTWMYGGDFYFLMRQAPGQQQNLIQLAILNHYYATFKLGYLALRKETRGLPFVLYPTIGAGIGHAFLRTSPSGLARYNRYSGTGILLEAAVNIAQFAEIRGSDNNVVKFGASIGYLYNAGGSQNLKTLVRGENIPVSPQGIFFRVSLGMGGS